MLQTLKVGCEEQMEAELVEQCAVETPGEEGKVRLFTQNSATSKYLAFASPCVLC